MRRNGATGADGRPGVQAAANFALDPGVSKLEGAIALVNVPYEPLRPGPTGNMFRMLPPSLCATWTRRPYSSNRGTRRRAPIKRFHHQMVYAVCSSVYAAFKAALGRDPVWGFVEERSRRRPPAPVSS